MQDGTRPGMHLLTTGCREFIRAAENPDAAVGKEVGAKH